MENSLEKIIYIIGLPGSGKTTLGNKLIKNKSSTFFLDDPSVSHKTQKPENFLKSIPRDTKTVILADPHLVVSTQEDLTALNKIVYPDCAVEFIYFENNPEACLANIQRRNKKDFRIISTGYMAFLSKTYANNLPENAKTIPVYKGRKPRKKASP